MKEKLVICDICGCEMSIQKDFGVKPRGKNKRSYGVKRYCCDICDFQKTLFANGLNDEEGVYKIKLKGFDK